MARIYAIQVGGVCAASFVTRAKALKALKRFAPHAQVITEFTPRIIPRSTAPVGIVFQFADKKKARHLPE